MNKHLSHLQGDGGQAVILGLDARQGGFGLSELILQLQDLLLEESLLTGGLQHQALFPALPVGCHLPVG